MIFEQIEAGGDRNFSYLIGDEDSRLCAVVDPGYDTSKLEARVKDLGLKVAYILNTHTHHDHVAGNGVFHQGDVKLAAYKEARVSPDVASYLKNKMEDVEKMEQRYHKRIHLHATRELPANRVEFSCYNLLGEKVVDFVR